MRPRAASSACLELGTFDNFNIVVAGVKGSLACRRRLIYQTLMTRSLDEPDSEYGTAGRSASPIPTISPMSIYRLRPAARWHDGKPVTPGGRDLFV